MFDQAVTTFGLAIENAASEQVQVGPEDKPRWEARYELADLLTDGFVIGGSNAGNSDDAPLPMGKIDGLLFDEVS